MEQDNKSNTLNLPALEERVLTFWKSNKIFDKVLGKESPKGRFVFFEGPPSANGLPGLHHALSRIFKDIIPRFKTMNGYFVERKSGWDTHGLPIELQVQKELGITSKKEIEQLKSTSAESIAYFNEKCRELVMRYTSEWEKFTDRIGFWLDMEHPYITCSNDYIESLWWIFKQIWDKGLVYQDYKVVPYCPSCVTALSSHEVAQGYDTVKEDSVYVKFRLRSTDSRFPSNTFFLVWTTTAWTLVGNVALVVGAEIDYVLVKQEDEHLILSKSRLSVLQGEYTVISEFKGRDVVNLEYDPLYNFFTNTSQRGWYILPAPFVNTDDGTGIVHMAWYGEEDYIVIKEHKLPWAQHINGEGRVIPEVERWKGMWFKELDTEVNKDLHERQLLYRVESYEHEYPFCWRCATPLLYHATTSWFIRMSSLRDELTTANETINWVPDYIKHGRFGEWLEGVKDWAVSRERYWGMPIPIWQCDECGERLCVGSFSELELVSGGILPKDSHGVLDPHRPYIDSVTVNCPKCEKKMRRVPDVMDVWFDSGAMPYAQWHYPFENRERIDDGVAFPADYISEAIDQTRGWFYSLLAVSVLMGRGAPYKNVICLGHIRDKFGKKMSKSKGNVVQAMEVIGRYGADALRWHLFTINQPGDYKDFDIQSVDMVYKKVFLILWNVFSFYEMYHDDFLLSDTVSDHLLDRWVFSELSLVNQEVTRALNQYDIFSAARRIAEFIDVLSTWYLRRSRGRLKSEDKHEKQQAQNTLRTVLFALSKMMAPLAPFMSEELFQRLKLKNDLTESVHLTEWPVVNLNMINESLNKMMSRLREIVAMSMEKRAEVKLPVRQVLSRLTVALKNEFERNVFLEESSWKQILAEEVNVLEVEFVKGDLPLEINLDTTLNEELKGLGMVREITRQVNSLRKSAGLSLHDRAKLSFESTSPRLCQIVEKYQSDIMKGTCSTAVEFEKRDSLAPHQKEMSFDGETLWITLR